MFRSSSKSCQLVHRAFSRPATRVNSSTKRSTLNSFACSVETVRPDNFGFSHTSLRDSTRARACFERQTITSHHSFNLLPIYDTFPTKATPYRIGLRFMNSDSKNSSGDTIHNNTTSSTTTDPAHVSLPNIPREAMPGSPKASVASQTSSLRGLADSVDTTIQGVRSKVNPKDLLYYFALLATFGILVVGPLVARHMQRSDTDYDELDSEDPIADLATFVRTEFLKDNGEGIDKGTTASTMGGLDTLIADLLRSPQIQNAINDLVNMILTSPQFKRSCSLLLKELWKDLVEDPETLKQVIHLLYNAIQDEAIKDAAVQLVTEVFADKEVLDEVVELFQRLGKEPKVQMATQELLVESAHNALNDPEILDHSMEFATDVVGDDVVQQTAGEALYNTLSYAVRPTLSVFLALLGSGLILISLMAFQHSISPESQSESLDKALTNLENSGLIQGVIKLVTFPWHALVTCKDALVWLLMLPIRAVSGTLNSLGRAGNATVDIINRCIRWLLNLPVHLTQSFLDAIGHGLTTMSEGLARHSRHLARALSGSFLGAFFHRLADGFLATTKGLEFAWNISNDIAASGALAVEAIGRQLFQFTQNGIALSISAWNATKSTLVIATQNVRTGWTSTNHTVACVAFAIEDGINLSWKAAFHLARRTETLATAMGITRDSMDTITEQSKLKLIAGYNSLDQAAERLGFFLEELLAKLSTKLKNARWNLRSP